jgi:predicted MFS family arabinose efflux permease
MSARRSLVPALATTMIIGYGSMFYAFAVLSRPIQAEMGWSAELTIGAYSLALLISGMGAYPVGHIVDRYGGRNLLALGSAAAGLLFMCLSGVQSVVAYYLIWIGIGFAMAMCLYEPAFAVVVAHFPDTYRFRIGALTLAGGLSSTVFWPITHALVDYVGWRDTVLVLGAINVAVCLPLHWFAVPAGVVADHHAAEATPELPVQLTPTVRRILHSPTFWLLIVAFTASGIVMSAMAVHVIPLLESRGFAPTAAVVIASLVGPMQVASRLTEMVFSKRVPTLLLGSVTVLLMPLGLAVLLVQWSALVYLFVLIYGAGLGLITIVRATAPPAFFGRSRYGSVTGLLAVPTVAARAIGPYVAAAMLTTFGSYTQVLTLLIGVGVLGAACYWMAVATRTTTDTAWATAEPLHSAAIRAEPS